MKKLLLFLLPAILFCPSVSAQKLGKQYLPLNSSSTPGWFKVFYNEDSLNAVNIFDLDAAALSYEKQIKNASSFSANAGLEEKTGEEAENSYITYFKRWRKAINQFVLNDGSIKNNNTSNTYKHTLLATKQVNTPNSANWNLLGPVSTYYKKSDNSRQPQAPWQANVYACAIAPSNQNILYAAAETGGIFKTTDKGLNWQLVLDEPNVGNGMISTFSGDAFFSIGVDPVNPDKVYVGRTGLIKKSVDGGATWSDNFLPSGDVNRLAVNPVNSARIYAACSNGLFYSSNSGASWNNILPGTCYDVVLNPAHPDSVYTLSEVSGKSKIYISANGGAGFTSKLLGNDISIDAGGRIAVSANDPNRIYAAILSKSPSEIPFIFKSSDAGNSWLLMCSGQNDFSGNNNTPLGMSNGQEYYDLDIMVDPKNADHVLVGTTSIYKSTNGAESFTRIGGYDGDFLIHPDVQCMTTAGTDSWIATDGGISYSSDFFTSPANYSTRSSGICATDFLGFTQGWNEDLVAGGKYHNMNMVLHENYPAGKALQLGGSEAPTGYYMMGTEGGVVFSDLDPGVLVPKTFDGATAGFPFNLSPNEDDFGFNASEVEFLPYCYGHVFAGNGNGLWKSSDAGVSWKVLHYFSSQVRQFEISRSNPDVMYVATDANLYKSANGGINWVPIALPAGQNSYQKSISLSYTDENTLWITAQGNSINNRVFKTTDGGVTWINLTTPAINAGSYNNIIQQAGTDGGVYILSKGGFVYYRNNSMADWVDYSGSLPRGFYPLRTIPFYRDGKLRTAGNRGIWQAPFYEESVPVAQPTVDKLTSNCARDTFYFDDFSAFNIAGGARVWTFTGSPKYISSASARNPKVVFGHTGSFDFSLTVSNGAGSSSKTISGKIQILSNDCGIDTIPGKLLTLSDPGDFAEQRKPLHINSNTLTLSCWIKPSGIQSSQSGIIFSATGGGTGLNFNDNNQLAYHWAGGREAWNGGPSVPANEWSHVALVITPVDATVYLNGIAYNNPGTANNPIYFDTPLQFGINKGNVLKNFKGLMEEVCVYNRALSTNEIRELMNLTRNNPNAGTMPADDPSLIAYYQFNEGNGKPAYDKAGFNNADLAGSASKADYSTAPVGGGNFERINVTNGGVKIFSAPGTDISFSSTGNLPEGDIVVTRLNVPPDQVPAGAGLSSANPSYYVIRNYGTNQVFSALENLQFNDLKGTSATLAASPFLAKLYMRPVNADGASWGKFMDAADKVTLANGDASVLFSTGLSCTGFGQFCIGLTNAPMPLEFLSFTAKKKNDREVLLSWKSSQEINLKQYEIERSVDGIHFRQLGIAGAGGPSEYYFTDASPIIGVNYYRLKIIGKDGGYNYSEIRKVTFYSFTSLSIFPNPSTNGWINFTLHGLQDKTGLSLSVTNTLGQLTKTMYLNDVEENSLYRIDLGKPGFYFIRVALTNGQVFTEKVLVED